MKSPIKHLNRISLIASIIILSMMSISCNNSSHSKDNEDNASKVAFNLEEAKKELQKSIADFRKALAKGDAKAAANYYTVDAIFMPNNAPVIAGRDNIEKALAGFIEGGFTKLNVESTWIEGGGEYLLDTEKWTLSNGEVTLIGKSLIVWKKEDGIWKMYKDMINTDTQ